MTYRSENGVSREQSYLWTGHHDRRTDCPGVRGYSADGCSSELAAEHVGQSIGLWEIAPLALGAMLEIVVKDCTATMSERGASLEVPDFDGISLHRH